MEIYRLHLAQDGYERHQSENKLRDAADYFDDNGHSFSFNREILYSFDICGSCEAHAILLSVKLGLAKDVEHGLLLKQLDSKVTANNFNFEKCPRRNKKV